MIHVLVAEDSATVRALLLEILDAAEGITVVGEATTGAEVVRMAGQLHPDVITMDIDMPEMDGLQATTAIMREVPTPIVIVSSAVRQSDLEMTMRALEVGAVAALPKPEGPAATDFRDYATQLVHAVRAMAEVKVVRRWSPDKYAPLSREEGGGRLSGEHPVVEAPGEPVRVVAIAASTGGPAALHDVLGGLPRGFPAAILVVQHIAQGFVPAMAAWLGEMIALPVVVAQDGVPLHPGTVYIAPSDAHLGVIRDRITLSPDHPIGGFRPSGTYLFRSVAAAYGSGAVGVILTGMGRDGVEGLRVLHAAGGFVIAQDEQTSVVYGMPQEAVRAGVVHRVLPLGSIAPAIAARVGANKMV